MDGVREALNRVVIVNPEDDGFAGHTRHEDGHQHHNSKAILHQRWRKALEKCRCDLTPADYESIQEFDCAEALFNDLRRRESEHSQSWMAQAGESVQNALRPTAQSLESISAVLMVTMIPYRPSFVGLWGLLHLATKVSLKSQEIWIDFLAKINTIQRKLEILDRCATCFPLQDESHEMSRAILSVFTTLVHFWVQAVNWNRRQQQTGPFRFTSLDRKFDAAISNVEEAVDHITKLLDIALKAKGGAELLQNIELAQENVTFPLFVLPRAASQLFYGREDTMTALEKCLNPKAQPGSLRSALLYGMGGIGKTSTALQYAHHKPSSYDAIFWVKSETAESLQKSFTEIATSLKLPGARSEGQDEQNLLYFKNWLRTQEARGDRGRKWLLIFDNCESMEIINNAKVLTTSGSVLITSRYQNVCLSDTKKLQLKPFQENDGITLLKRFLTFQNFTPAEEDALSVLVKKVAGLPLGIRILAALINARTCPLTEYPAFFTRHSRKLFVKAEAPEDYPGQSKMDKGHVLDQLWLMSFANLRSDAKSLLGMMSFLSSEDILPSMFQLEAVSVDMMVESTGVLSVCEDEYDLHAAIESLHKAALLDIDKSHDGNTMALSVHRLIQEAFLYNIEDNERQDYFDAAVRVVYEAFPHQINGRPLHDQWSKCRAAIQHGISLGERFMEFQGRKNAKQLRTLKELGELLKNCAWYKFEMAEYDAALAILSTARNACTDKKSELYAHLLNTEGCCYFELNELRKCRDAWEKALALRKQFAESHNPDTEEEYANQVNNFGNLETAEGNLDAALKYFSKAEDMRVKMGTPALISLGLTHLTTGRAYFEKGEYVEAEKRYQMAEDIFVRKFGPRTHFMAHLQYARGNMAQARQLPSPAQSFYEEAQSILQEEESTKYHLLMSACYYKIACLQLKLGELAKAKESLSRARRIAELRGAIGDAARIIRKQAEHYSLVGTVDSTKEAESHQRLADLQRARCPDVETLLGGCEDHEKAWDKLVCGYWR